MRLRIERDWQRNGIFVKLLFHYFFSKAQSTERITEGNCENIFIIYGNRRQFRYMPMV